MGAQSVHDRLRVESARLHAQSAVVAELARELQSSDRWRGGGMRSCAEYLVVHFGFDMATAQVLLRAGRAAVELPQVGEAFSSGELSLDKVRSISTIATPADQGRWLEVARVSSPPQLARRAREDRSAALTDSAERARAQRAQRSLRTWWDRELGMLRLSGALPPEEGKVVELAIQGAERLQGELPIDDPAEDRDDARRADALVALCRGAHASEAPGAPVKMIVHVDLDVLRGTNPDGRGHLQDGPALSTATLRRMGCNASIVTMTERDGLPIDRGGERRIVSDAQREAVISRDRVCRFPGCPNSATRCEPHHVLSFYLDGPTELWNLVALCRFHHHRCHDEVRILWCENGALQFVDALNDEPIGCATGGAWRRPREWLWLFGR